MQKKCEELNSIKRKYKLLKESYERLITINKNFQEQAKDKAFAQDVLMAEMRTNYDTVKAENLKLIDSLETQHKLWKVWLLKMDDREISPAPVSESNTNVEADKEEEPVEDVAHEEAVGIIDDIADTG